MMGAQGFNLAKGLVQMGYDTAGRLDLQVASSTLGESLRAILTARHLQPCLKS